MIVFKSYSRNFESIQDDVGEYMPHGVRSMLESGISGDITEIILEAPYVDMDFRDTYYNDFSKRFTDISRDSIRLHFFYDKDHISSENYGGFITLRDTKIFTIGRSYLNPKALSSYESGYYCLADYPVNFKGRELTVSAFPWMQQDGNVSRCAHIAAWGVNRYYSQKYNYYAERTLHEITVHDSTTRRVPSKGATINQIAQILQKNRFDPEIYIRDNGLGDSYYTSEEFNRLIYTFIESGIPCIAGIKRKHAVVIIGHGELSDISKATADCNGLIDSYIFIENVVVSDDNVLPYSKAYNYENDDDIKFDDIDVIIVPFYQKMYLDINWLYKNMLPALEYNVLRINSNENLIRRVLLTSSRSFKKFVAERCDDKAYRDALLCMQMPKFIWIIEYSSIAEFMDNKVRFRIVLDATMLNFQDDAFINIKRYKELAIKNKSAKGVIETDCELDNQYVNNLRRI